MKNSIFLIGRMLLNTPENYSFATVLLDVGAPIWCDLKIIIKELLFEARD